MGTMAIIGLRLFVIIRLAAGRSIIDSLDLYNTVSRRNQFNQYPLKESRAFHSGNFKPNSYKAYESTNEDDTYEDIETFEKSEVSADDPNAFLKQLFSEFELNILKKELSDDNRELSEEIFDSKQKIDASTELAESNENNDELEINDIDENDAEVDVDVDGDDNNKDYDADETSIELKENNGNNDELDMNDIDKKDAESDVDGDDDDDNDKDDDETSTELTENNGNNYELNIYHIDENDAEVDVDDHDNYHKDDNADETTTELAEINKNNDEPETNNIVENDAEEDDADYEDDDVNYDDDDYINENGDDFLIDWKILGNYIDSDDDDNNNEFDEKYQNQSFMESEESEISEKNKFYKPKALKNENDVEMLEVSSEVFFFEADDDESMTSFMANDELDMYFVYESKSEENNEPLVIWEIIDEDDDDMDNFYEKYEIFQKELFAYTEENSLGDENDYARLELSREILIFEPKDNVSTKLAAEFNEKYNEPEISDVDNYVDDDIVDYYFNYYDDEDVANDAY